MSYNDGWRKYEDTPEHVVRKQILLTSKSNIEKQLEKQIKKIGEVSNKNRLLTLDNSTRKRRSTANLKLQGECEVRDNLQRKIYIIEEWVKEIGGINMNIINKEDIIASNGFCSECRETKNVKIVEVADNYIELCEGCRKKLIDMLQRTI